MAGRALVVLSPLAKVGMRVAGLAPALTTRVMGVTSRLLPGARGERGNVTSGHDARDALSPRARRVVDALTKLGDRASQRNNEMRRG